MWRFASMTVLWLFLALMALLAREAPGVGVPVALGVWLTAMLVFGFLSRGQARVNPIVAVGMLGAAVCAVFYGAVWLSSFGPIKVFGGTAALTALTAGAMWWRGDPRKARRRASAGLCERCGYDLRKSFERCPECGGDIPEDLARRRRWYAEAEQRRRAARGQAG